MQNTKIKIRGKEYIATSRAWWLKRQDITKFGVMVASISAMIDGDDRNYIVDLTDDDIVSNNLMPGRHTGYGVVVGPRPITNKK